MASLSQCQPSATMLAKLQSLLCYKLLVEFFYAHSCHNCSHTQRCGRGLCQVCLKPLHCLLCPLTMSRLCRSLSHGNNIKRERNSAAQTPSAVVGNTMSQCLTCCAFHTEIHAKLLLFLLGFSFPFRVVK